jgi:hypothetical protein
VFGEGIFGDLVWADLQVITTTPIPVFSTPGDGDMIPLYRILDDDELALILAAALK